MYNGKYNDCNNNSLLQKFDSSDGLASTWNRLNEVVHLLLEDFFFHAVFNWMQFLCSLWALSISAWPSSSRRWLMVGGGECDGHHSWGTLSSSRNHLEHIRFVLWVIILLEDESSTSSAADIGRTAVSIMLRYIFRSMSPSILLRGQNPSTKMLPCCITELEDGPKQS